MLPNSGVCERERGLSWGLARVVCAAGTAGEGPLRDRSFVATRLTRWRGVSDEKAAAAKAEMEGVLEGVQPYTLHPTPYTLHPTPYTLHPKHQTLNSQP